MITPTSRSNRMAAAGIAVTALFFLAAPATAQSTGPATTAGDWSAWVGCWEPVEPRLPDAGQIDLPGQAEAAKAGADRTRNLVCVLPTEDQMVAELATIVDGEVVERARIDASGAAVTLEIEGCSGWESANWSADRSRIFLRSAFVCPGDLHRSTTGVLTITPGEELLHVESIAVGENSIARALRYRPASPGIEVDGLPAEIGAALAHGRSLASRTARVDVARPLTIAAVAEAAEHLDNTVIQGWLVEQSQGFELDAAKLIELEKAGVAPDLIDVMIALSYPEAFTIDRAPYSAGINVAEVPRGPAHASVDERYAAETLQAFGPLGLYGPWYRYGYGSSLYSPYSYYGYYGYDFARRYGYHFGWAPEYPSRVIVIRDSDKEREERRKSRVVKGRGYTRGGRPADSNARPGPANTHVGPSASTSSSAGSSSTVDNSTSRGTTSTPTRTAKPRNGGGT